MALQQLIESDPFKDPECLVVHLVILLSTGCFSKDTLWTMCGGFSVFNLLRPHTVYPTGWAGDLTSQEIYDDLAHYASNVMKRNGFRPHEIPECLQNGFMELWETLVARHDFLKEKTRRQTVFFILARSKISSMRYKAGMYDSLAALISDDWHYTLRRACD